MANEITASCSLRYRETPIDIEFSSNSFNDDVAGNDGHFLTQVVTTSEAPLELGTVGTLGYFKARNNSSTSTEIIRLRTDTTANSGVEFARINPGAECMFQWDETITAPQVTSDLGSPQLMYAIIEA